MTDESDEKLNTIEKVGAALVEQLTRVVDHGVGPLAGSRTYAEARAASYSDPERAIRRIINETTVMAGTAGFVTSLGGFITLPVTLPAHITGQAILNARAVAAIAHLRGWDLRDEVVRQAILITIAGGSPNAVLAGFGVKVTRKLAETAIQRLHIEVLRSINKKVGFMLVAKYGTRRSVVTLTKLVPGIGGVVGGTVDATFTRVVARVAKKAFPPLGSDDNVEYAGVQ
ncbi:EcsC family protein [Streptomyces sp. NPDC101209]|uniref:EcsC family protein n=1 Tax=Streptomyces sp. NPDC101209 TaxID=3366129 RepID=UPI003800F1F4